MNNWEKVWNTKKVLPKKYNLDELIKFSGYDSNHSTITDLNFKKMIYDYMFWINLEDDVVDVLEIGCGPGAFYYVLRELMNKFSFTGIDYNSDFINYLKANYPEEEFSHSKADEFNPSKKYDFVFSHSVFQYFVDWDYAKKVIEKMTSSLKPGGSIAILDLIDVDKFDEYIEFRISRGGTMNSETMSASNHLSFSRNELKGYLESLGFIDIDIRESHYDFYENSRYRFHIKAKKR